MNKEITQVDTLLGEIKELINRSRQEVAITVNATITLLYWQIGNRINTEILSHKRAEYGKQIVKALSTQLTLNSVKDGVKNS